jgi:FCD domain.
MHSALIIHSTRLAVRRMTDEDIKSLNNLVEILENSDSAQRKTQSDMRCLLTLAANSQSARLAGQELIILTEWAPLISILYKADQFHLESLGYYRKLIHALTIRDETLATHPGTFFNGFFISSLIKYKISFL